MSDSSQDVRKKALGRAGEKRGAKYLKKRGYKILATNYRTPFGEADIVAKEGDTVVFCEVKTRSGDRFGTPAEAVGPDKRRRYMQIARYYQMNAGEEVNVRFDVLEVSEGEINHIISAFEA